VISTTFDACGVGDDIMMYEAGVVISFVELQIARFWGLAMVISFLLHHRAYSDLTPVVMRPTSIEELCRIITINAV
jgi:hypothetical protein